MSNPNIEDILKGLLGLRISDDLCNDLAKLESVAEGLMFAQIANELHIAHTHVHNAIRLCVNDNEEITEALDQELMEASADFQKFISEVRDQF
jgi:hypothetical protein